eukprot:520090-Pleurochrysis_carterae.AAC.1
MLAVYRATTQCALFRARPIHLSLYYGARSSAAVGARLEKAGTHRIHCRQQLFENRIMKRAITRIRRRHASAWSKCYAD